VADAVPARPLIVTDDPLLLDDLLRLAADAGVEVDVRPRLAAAAALWPHAPVAVLGPDAARGESLPRRPGVVLVGADLDDASVWDTSAAVGSEHVVFLPDAEPWLVTLLADTAPRPPTRVVGVVGGRGGAGATTLAVALALRAAKAGLRVVLVDADGLGGGIDLSLGAEEVPGPRWPEVAHLVGTGARPGRLPEPRSALTVLSWDRSDRLQLPAEVVTRVFEMLTTTGPARGDLILVDLPRVPDPVGSAALARCDVVLLVVPAEVRACAAAARVAQTLTLTCPDVRVVVRGPAPGRLRPGRVAAALGLPLAGVLRAEPGLAADLERGLPPGRRQRGPLGRFARSFLDGLDLPAPPA